MKVEYWNSEKQTYGHEIIFLFESYNSVLLNSRFSNFYPTVTALKASFTSFSFFLEKHLEPNSQAELRLAAMKLHSFPNVIKNMFRVNFFFFCQQVFLTFDADPIKKFYISFVSPKVIFSNLKLIDQRLKDNVKLF